MRWIEPVVSDEARHLLKVAWQLVGLMTRTEHRSFSPDEFRLDLGARASQWTCRIPLQD